MNTFRSVTFEGTEKKREAGEGNNIMEELVSKQQFTSRISN